MIIKIFLNFLSRLRYFFTASFFIFSFSAHSAMPESGWYWNENEPGRGYAIEIQNNSLFIAAFTYDANGFQNWYYSSGTMTGDSYYSGRFLQAVNGSCFGCAQRGPANKDLGPVSISFNGSTATLTFGSFATTLKRFDFQGDNSVYPNACYGEWSGVIGSPSFPVYFGDRIRFSSYYDATNLTGYRTGDSSRVAICGYDVNTHQWSILIDTSDSYFTFFMFNFAGLNRMEGTSWTFLKTELPTGSGLNWVAFRTASKNFVQGKGGPATAKATEHSPASTQSSAASRLAQDRELEKLSSGRELAPSHVQEAYRAMLTKLGKR